MDALGTTRLTEEIPADRAVTAIVRREEISGVLDDPVAQPELVLQILAGDGEAHTISLDWCRDDLEALLLHASGDTVSLQFDRDELSGALGDVEAHGIRERALVFTVAAVAALGAGTGARAMLAPTVGGSLSPLARAEQASEGVLSTNAGGSLSPLARSEQMSEGVLPGGAGGTQSAASEQFLGIDTTDATDAILVGGVLLTLTGATFAARRAGTARPA